MVYSKGDGCSCSTGHLDCVHRLLNRQFARYGLFVAQRPLPFIIVPTIIALCLGIGMIRLDQETSSEYLFTPTNGPAKDERRQAERLFPMNDATHFNGLRLDNFGRFVRVIVIPKSPDVKTVVRSDVLNEMLRLHEFITNISYPLPYQLVCAKDEGLCVQDPLLELIHSNRSRYLALDFTFPVTVTETKVLFLGNSLGGVEYASADHISSVSAAKMTIWLRESKDSEKWENEVIDQMEHFHSDVIDAKPLTSQSLDNEMSAITGSVIPLFTIAFTLLISFAVMSLNMLDWVRTKTLIGNLGVISPALAILASLGFLSAIGVQFCNVVGSMPFLIMGIGVDDMFIIVEAYRHTKPEDTVEKRMSETFAEAAVSITITSITDFLSFAIGAITVFPAVQLFCLYTALAVIFDYILQITLFAACMAYDARREDTNRHGVTLRVVYPKVLSQDLSPAYRLFCSGGVKHLGKVVAKEEEHLAAKIIRQYYGPLLIKKPVKAVVIVLYIAYLAVSLYGCTQVKEGLESHKLARDDSDTHVYFRRDDEYFVEYGPQVMFMKTQKANYWEKSVQTELENAIREATSNRYVGTTSSKKVTWWLNDFRDYLNRTRGTADVDENTFMSVLRQEFLLTPQYRPYNLDVRFGQGGTTITASRFLVHTNNLTNSNLQSDMMTTFRDIAEKHSLVAYHPAFIFFDQFTAVLPNTLQNIGIALVAMLIVSIIIIPHPVYTPLIILAIMSIVVGVVGLMQFWGVHLDAISMINLILSIGFSVDFCAHVTYAFMASKSNTRDGRAVDALHQLGYPIVQGAISTILGTVPLAFSNTYIFRSFFKTLFLVISLGFTHGMVILPVFMSLVGRSAKEKTGDESNGHKNGGGHLSNGKTNGNPLEETGSSQFPLVIVNASFVDS